VLSAEDAAEDSMDEYPDEAAEESLEDSGESSGEAKLFMRIFLCLTGLLIGVQSFGDELKNPFVCFLTIAQPLAESVGCRRA
jgi:hypothetical protein